MTPTRLRIAGREAWGADETLGGNEPYELMDPRTLVVHHTHTPSDLDDGATLRGIQRLHVVEKGWNDIGYHLAVGRDGGLYECRRSEDPLGTSGEVVVGAHAFAANVGSIGIAVLGDFHDHAPSPMAWAALIGLCTELCALHGIDPNGEAVALGTRVVAPPIGGHRDARPRDMRPIRCPGAVLTARLPELAVHVADGLAAHRA